MYIMSVLFHPIEDYRNDHEIKIITHNVANV